MNTTTFSYPVFDANQVLTDEHLNSMVAFLGEQERLTRANLIGIGIPCGLELVVDRAAARVSIGRGCAVTSQGHLIAEPLAQIDEPALYTHVREYALPESDPYAPLAAGPNPPVLWELVEVGTPGALPLADAPGLLDDKCVLLFLEQDNEDLKSCSPNDCDNKGSQLTQQVRALLVPETWTQELAQAQNLFTGRSAALELPALPVPRYDAPAQGELAATRHVLQAFQRMLSSGKLVQALSNALGTTYDALRPWLRARYPQNPFGGLLAKLGHLDAQPGDAQEARFLQYSLGAVRDLIAGYEELRQHALGLEHVCAPAEDAFPRHVILGPQHRTGWFPSPATCGACSGALDAALQLFVRLDEMWRSFSFQPALREAGPDADNDLQVVITPSRARRAPLSERSIPYYYEFVREPPLYRLWDPARSSQGRSAHNLGYRVEEYAPPAPAFARAPLAYDLAPYDFLRIEGHLGKPYAAVLQRLEHLRQTLRLPFAVVAVRTGDELLDGLDEAALRACHVQDLASAYRMLREELRCLTKKAMIQLGGYKLKQYQATAIWPLPRRAKRGRAVGIASTHTPLGAQPLILGVSPSEAQEVLQVKPDTLGQAYLEQVQLYGLHSVTLVEESVTVNTALEVFAQLNALSELLVEELHKLDFDQLEASLSALEQLYETIQSAQDAEEDGDDLSWDDLRTLLGSVVFACRMQGLLALRKELAKRLKALPSLATLRGYQERHPGLQHEAGVPVGGTFVLVVHGASAQDESSDDVYAAAARSLESGQVIADYCLPYLCASDCPPVQIVIPEPQPAPVVPPSLTTRLHCTSAAGRAKVEVSATQGAPPYELRSAEQAWGPFPHSIEIELAPGPHKLELKDAAGVDAAPVQLVVPEPLLLGEPTYADDPASQTYAATLSVSGGTPPYASSQGSVVNGTVQIQGLASGTQLEVRVIDAAGCEVTTQIAHEVELGCDLPCKGLATRRRYPAWAPVPHRDDPYRYAGLRLFRVLLADEDGNRLFDEDLSALVAPLLDPNTPISSSSYPGKMEQVCATVSQAVAGALDPALGETAFAVDYDRATSTLRIEAYNCHAFRIQIEFQLAGQQLELHELWTYTDKGVQVEHRSGENTAAYATPSFGPVALDKCQERTLLEECQFGLRSIRPSWSDNALMLQPTFASSVEPEFLEYRWRVFGRQLTVSNKPVLKIPREDIGAYYVQLLVLEQANAANQRCWVYREAWIQTNSTTSIRARRRLS